MLHLSWTSQPNAFKNHFCHIGLPCIFKELSISKDSPVKLIIEELRNMLCFGFPEDLALKKRVRKNTQVRICFLSFVNKAVIALSEYEVYISCLIKSWLCIDKWLRRSTTASSLILCDSYQLNLKIISFEIMSLLPSHHRNDVKRWELPVSCQSDW